MKIVFQFIQYIALYLPILPIVIGIIQFKKLRIEHHIFIIFLFIASVLDIIPSINYKLGTENHMKIITIVEYISLAVFYNLTFRKFKISKTIFISSVLIFLLIISIELLIQDTNPVDFISSTIEGITFTVYSTILIFKQGLNNKIHISTIYINYGSLVYFSSTLVLFLFNDFLIEEYYDLIFYIWQLNNLVNILTYTLANASIISIKLIRTSVELHITLVDDGDDFNHEKGRSLIIPRLIMIKLFVEDEADTVRIFFGLDSSDELKPMQKDPNAGSGAIVVDRSNPCPFYCPKQGL